MGWWDEIKGWGSSLYNNKPLVNSVNSVGNYSYNTVLGMFELVNAAPKAVHSAVYHPKTRMVAGHVTRIIVEDLLPLVAVTYANDMIQRTGRDYCEDESDSALLSIDTAIQMGLGLLQLATWTYSVRKKMQIAVRMTVLTMEAGKAFNEVRKESPMTRCIKEQCPILQFLQGSIRDTISYFATEAAISLIGYIPYVGGCIAAVLSIHHHGRYIMTIVLPDLCNEHQVEMLTEYSEQALSLGLGHAALTFLAVHGIEYLTHVPRSFYEAAIQQFMLLTTVCVAAHRPLPPAITKRGLIKMLADPDKMSSEELKPLINHKSSYASYNSKFWYIKIAADGDLKVVALQPSNVAQLEVLFNGRSNELKEASKKELSKITSLTGHSSFRSQHSPVATYQALVGFLVDTFILGLRKQIPRLLSEPSSSISWEVIINDIVKAWQHPYAKKMESLFLPRMLMSARGFSQDPVIAPNWEELRTTLIVAIENIEQIRGKFFVRVGVTIGSLDPEVTARALELTFGAPKTVVKLVLKLMANEAFMSQLSSARRKLEGLDLNGNVEVVPNVLALQVCEEISLTPPEIPLVDHEVPAGKVALKAENVIKMKTRAPRISSTIFNEIPVNVDDKKETKAERIIGRKTPGLFKPESVIRLRTPKKTSSEDVVELPEMREKMVELSRTYQ